MATMLRNVILVTGGSGLIGQAVARRFAPEFDVVALDVKKPKHVVPNVTFIPMDVSSPGSVNGALEQIRKRYGGRIASVIHLAAYYSFSGEHSSKYDEITVRGTERLLEGIKDLEVEQFIFSSTMLVHAPCEIGQTIDESWPLNPKWPYPQSKVDAENIIKEKHNGVPYVILRIAGVYDDRCHSIPIAHQIERIYERHLTSHFYPGDVSKGQSFVHMDDLIDALYRAVTKRKELPRELTLLIGEPETMSYAELQDDLGLLIHGDEWDTLRIPKPAAKAGSWAHDKLPVGEEPFIKPWMVDLADDHFALDISRSRKLLGWEPKHKLKETLPKMLEFLKSDLEGFYRENKLSKPIKVAVWARKTLPKAVAVGVVSLLGYLVFKKQSEKRAA